MKQPHYRPIAAEGCFAAFFEMHNVTIEAMRQALLNLIDRPTLENARALGEFWQDVLVPHARAEDETLWNLARSIGDPKLTRSTDLVAAEHATIDQGIADYMAILADVEAGRAEASALVPVAEDLRIRTELHFGKEEITVVRPLQRRLTSTEFLPVMTAFDRKLGAWLRTRGWTMRGCGLGTSHQQASPATTP